MKILCLLSLLLPSAYAKKPSSAVATFAGGCFWCTESELEKIPGVTSVVSGYTGGVIPNPTYQQVSSGKTQHRECVQVTFDPKIISYSKLLDYFWNTIDPTDAGGQFVDRGHHYTSAIYYHDDKQKEEALASREKLQNSKRYPKPIVTPIEAFKVFYPAEDYHQNYYKKDPIGYQSYRRGSGRDQFFSKNSCKRK